MVGSYPRRVWWGLGRLCAFELHLRCFVFLFEFEGLSDFLCLSHFLSRDLSLSFVFPVYSCFSLLFYPITVCSFKPWNEAMFW